MTDLRLARKVNKMIGKDALRMTDKFLEVALKEWDAGKGGDYRVFLQERIAELWDEYVLCN